MKTLAPGSIIGIIGGGQLGRMLALAAAPLGYRVHIFAPEPDPCAGDVAWRVTQAEYDDTTALAAFAAEVDVVTFEFENVPVAPLLALGDTPVFPPTKALEVGQDRATEKSFAARFGARTAPWAPVADRAALDAAIAQIGTPAILKSARFGYDGKGQAFVNTPSDAEAAWDAINGQPAILEAKIAFKAEFSLIGARGQNGALVFYDPPQNVHKNGVLATSTVPADPIIKEQLVPARALARRMTEELNYVGVFAIEFFATADAPLFNEMAPRVHNSGHWTIEGAETSQFENHIRAICGLPLGSTALAARSVVMTNLIGDDVERWGNVLMERSAHLHLYGKAEARNGRKMGHVTRVTR